MSGKESHAEFEILLTEMQHETAERLEQMKNSAVAPALDGTIGRVTHMDAFQQHQMALHGQRKLEQKLELIKAALARLRAGTYGTCVECGASIPPERLEFLPEMPYCVACNERIGR